MNIISKITSGFLSAVSRIRNAINTKTNKNDAKKATVVTKKTDEDNLTETDFDGKISATKQGDVGDCWLLSGVNALNSTKEGKKVIENSLEYSEHIVTVHLATGDYSYSKIFLDVLSNSGNSSSTGDTDMVALELAISESIKDLKKGNINIKTEGGDSYIKFQLQEYLEAYESKDTGGDPQFLFLLLAGRESKSSSFFLSKAFSIYNFFKDKKSDNNNIAAVASSFEDKNVQDAKGNKISIRGNHAYSIKKSNLKTVTIIDPADSSKEITLPLFTFLNCFQRITSVDLSGSDVSNEYFSKKSQD